MEKVLDWIITGVFVLAMIAIGLFFFKGVQNMMNGDSITEESPATINDYVDEDDYDMDGNDDRLGEGDGENENAAIAAKEGDREIPESYDNENLSDDELKAKLAEESANTKTALSDAASSLSNAAAKVKDGAVDAAKDVKDGVTDAAKDVKDSAVDAATTAKEGVTDAASTVKEKLTGAGDDAKSAVDADGFDFSDDDDLAAKGGESVAKGDYLVMAGVFSTQANADRQIAFLKKKGCTTPETAKFGGAWGKITVIASRHTTESAARKHAKELQAKKVDCYVHKKRAK